METIVDELFDPSGLIQLLQPEALLYLGLVVFLLWVGRLLYARSVAYPLLSTIAEEDNKAATVALTGYLFGLGLACWGALTAHGLPSLFMDLLDMAILGLCGALLLWLGQRVADRFVFPAFITAKEIAAGNLAAGIAEAGGFVGTGLIVMRALSLDGVTFWVRLADSAIFFVAGQACFVLFAALYQRVVGYDCRQQIEDGNAAAGLSLGLTFIAQGVVLSYAIHQTASLVVFVGWALLSGALLLAFRFFVDRVLLHGHSLDREIERDRNWGIAMLEGCLSVVVSLVVTGAF